MTSSEPANTAESVTPSDSTDLTVRSRALYIGGSGDLVVILTPGSSPVTFASCPAGVLPVQASRVLSTGTTATGIVALW